MTFNKGTIWYRIALSISVVWIAFVAVAGFIAFNRVNYFDHFDQAAISCTPANKCDAWEEAKDPSSSTSERARDYYNDARLGIVKEASGIALIPAAVLLALAGFSGSIWNVAKRYGAWLRNG